MNLFKGIRLYNGSAVTGNLIYDKDGNRFIIPVDDIELDGHHLIINSDIPVFIDQLRIKPVNKIKDEFVAEMVSKEEMFEFIQLCISDSNDTQELSQIYEQFKATKNEPK